MIWICLKKLHAYSKINLGISTSNAKAFKRHLWYLTSEMVPVSLFSANVEFCDKDYLSQKLLECKPTKKDENLLPENRFGTGPGKPKFPNMDNVSKLGDLIDKDSWYIFKLLDIDPSFLEQPALTWLENGPYIEACEKIRSLNCVNDCAERGVKLSADFLECARLEDNYQNILQVVEDNRKLQPNLRKPSKINQ
ncbi:hypothetical protein SNE40_007401 [Patella caerulea]|uniref:Uncharacterized protein n=1 Tax=Patella caerulea TaxID=87958 RepID=A0AAN8JTQ3_PATCE